MNTRREVLAQLAALAFLPTLERRSPADKWNKPMFFRIERRHEFHHWFLSDRLC
jgi:hypothetical protein